MNFSLDDELMEQIIFAMEDQQHSYLIHRGTGELVRTEEAAGEDSPDQEAEAFLPIPEWQPVHGFRLMEKFVSRLRNPLLRDRLSEALSSGKGVFRKFKDILKDNREIERFWFTFKERELRLVVWQWYNDQRELAGLERLEEEPQVVEGLEDLLASDFSFSAAEEHHLDSILALDREAFTARFPEAEPAAAADCYQSSRSGLPGPLDRDSFILVAETPEQDFAGFVWAVKESDPLSGGRLLRLRQLAVVLRYRGVGLGALLLKKLIVEARDRGYHRVRSELDGTCLALAGLFAELGFRPVSQVMELDPSRFEQ